MIQLAHMASSNQSAQVCALTWRDKDGMDLHAFLRELVGIQWHALVDEGDGCAGGLQYYAGYRTSSLGANGHYTDYFGRDGNMIRAYAISVEANLRWMQDDFARSVGQFSPLFVIIQRRNVSRSFRDDSLEQLKDSMRVVRLGGMPLPLTVYYGSEDVVATVRMFAQAAEVLGYHGAAWANTLFSARRHCMHQITTFEDLEGKRRWRVNNEVKINPMGKFNVYKLPLKKVLKENKVAVADFNNSSDKDHFIKKLAWVPLKSYDVTNLKAGVRGCLKDWVEGHW
jgi:hypothetical protein